MTAKRIKQDMLPEGWVILANSRKAHFFRNGKSLCGKWMYFGKIDGLGLDGADFISPDDCAECSRRRQKELPA
jgi:hypothetical protein